MKITNIRTVQITSYLLLVLAVMQALFTALSVAGVDVSRQLFWGLEGLLFTILAAFAGAGMVQSKSY